MRSSLEMAMSDRGRFGRIGDPIASCQSWRTVFWASAHVEWHWNCGASPAVFNCKALSLVSRSWWWDASSLLVAAEIPLVSG